VRGVWVVGVNWGGGRSRVSGGVVRGGSVKGEGGGGVTARGRGGGWKCESEGEREEGGGGVQKWGEGVRGGLGKGVRGRREVRALVGEGGGSGRDEGKEGGPQG